MNNLPPTSTIETSILTSLTSNLFRLCISWTFWVILSILLVVYCGRAISDPDFWWHLKSGEVMLNQGVLLYTDPFNYTGDMVVDRRESVILKGYWLWQVAAALFYHIAGIYGIFAFKMMTLLLMAGAVFREMRRQAVSPFVQQILIGLGALVLIGGYEGFSLERPQIYSFIFLTAQLGMVAQIRLERGPDWMLLPLMLVWSNVHGGFVVGDILLILFAAGAIIKFRNDRTRLGVLLFWAAAGIAVSFANPSGWNAVIEAFDFARQNLSDQVEEYKNSWTHFSDVKLIGLLWLIVGLHAAGMFFSRRIFWPEIAISVFLILFGLKYLRNAPFIAISLIPMTGWYLDQASFRLGQTRTRWLQIAALTIVSALLVWQTAREWDKRKAGWPVEDYYPEKMALFLRNSGLSGHLFNDYSTGGYLDWALYPKWQTFIDGRGLDHRVFNHFTEIFDAGKSYEILLEQYKIDVVALGIRERDGLVTPLLKTLLNNPGWFPVYLDRDSFILARGSEKNSDVIRQFNIDKRYFLNSILMNCSGDVIDSPDLVISTGCTDMLIYTGKFPEAEILLKRIEQKWPEAGAVPLLRHQINSLTIK